MKLFAFDDECVYIGSANITDAAIGKRATANYELTMMYWHIGERINREVLGNQRAEYGKQIVASVARQLREEYGSKGFDEKNIRRMMQFAQVFPDIKIVSPLVSKLSVKNSGDGQRLVHSKIIL